MSLQETSMLVVSRLRVVRALSRYAKIPDGYVPRPVGLGCNVGNTTTAWACRTYELSVAMMIRAGQASEKMTLTSVDSKSC